VIFDWDKEKNIHNPLKQGIDFNDASALFFCAGVYLHVSRAGDLVLQGGFW